MDNPNGEAWTWPNSLDALAAAPESHRLLFENDVTRVLETRIGPGETTQLHTHRWPGILYVLSFGHFVRRDGEGTVLVDTRQAGPLPQSGTALWSGALPPHTLENVDTSEIHVIGVELKHR
jgi:quercetin dioxygenase-like cupin family protein